MKIRDGGYIMVEPVERSDWCDECLTSSVEIAVVMTNEGVLGELKRCTRCHPWEEDE